MGTAGVGKTGPQLEIGNASSTNGADDKWPGR